VPLQLQWIPTLRGADAIKEYRAQLPTGGTAVLRLCGGIWLTEFEGSDEPRKNGAFATAADAQSAVAVDETERVLQAGLAALKARHARPAFGSAHATPSPSAAKRPDR